MSVIIRLQNLPLTASSLDIRQFFRNLAIPDGGVNIVGGDKGDAFIAFSTDEDARQAMMQNGNKIKDTPISLFLSSRAEMQKTIEIARARTLSLMNQTVAAPVVIQPKPAYVPPVIQPQPPIITMSGFLSQPRPTPSVVNGTIEIPGLSNGYSTAGSSLLFNPNLPANMPSIVDTSSRPAMSTMDPRIRQQTSPRNDSRSRSRSRSPRGRGRSRSPRNRRRGGGARRSRSRSRSRGRRNRSSSEDSFDGGRYHRGSFDSNKPSYQSGSGVPAFSSNPRQEFNRMQMAHNNGERVDVFGRKIPEPGRDVFGREIRTNREEEPNACIKLSGLDRNTGYGELRRLFPGMFITANGIKMINAENGERIGVALVRFARRSDKEVALARVNVTVRDCPITVSDVSDKEFEESQDNFKPNIQRRDREREAQKQADMDHEFTCIRVTDLPPYATEQDIMKMFPSQYPIMQIVMGRNAKKVHEAYAKFYRHNDARDALKSTPSCRIQHKIVHTSKCSELEFEAARNEFELEVQLRQEEEEQREKEQQEKERKKREEEEEEKQRSEERIKKRRFSPPHTEMRQSSIAPRDPRKPPSVQQTPSIMDQMPQITSSIVGHSSALGGVIPPSILQTNVLPPLGIGMQNLQNGNSPFPPMMMTNSGVPNDPRKRVADADPIGSSSPGNGYSTRDPRRRADPRLAARQQDTSTYNTDADCILMQNLPKEMGEWDVEEYLKNIGIHPDVVECCRNAQNQATGDMVCEFSTPEQARKAKKLESVNIGDCKVTIELISRAEAKRLADPNGLASQQQQQQQQQQSMMMDRMNGQRGGNNNYDNQQRNYDGPNGMDDRGRMMDRMNGNNNNNRFQQQNRFNNNSGPGGMGGNGGNNLSFEGRVILLENIPYKANAEDILEFFGPMYNLNPDHVRRRFNERGQPAGEAKVLFQTPDDCLRAYNSRHGSMLMNRKIYLKIQ